MSNSFLQFASITKKVVMGLAGIFLMVFLAVHLYINLLLIKGDGGVAFGEVVKFMSGNIFISIFEYVLFGALIIHFLIGIILKLQNWKARPVGYKVCQKSETSFFSKYQIYTGLIVVIFLVIHFLHFFFVKLGLVSLPEVAASRHDFYPMAIKLFTTPLYSWTYIILIAILGFHLYHAFQSFFQTIGFQHSKYFTAIKVIGALYSIVICAGFIVIPVYFMYFFCH